MNKWRTLSLVYNKGIFKVYDNCQIIFDLNNYPTINALCGNEPVQMSLGNVPMDLISQYGYRYFKGKIDDLQIYMRALSEREVKLYANIECIEKPGVQIAVSKDTCRPSVMDFTDDSDMKGPPYTDGYGN